MQKRLQKILSSWPKAYITSTELKPIMKGSSDSLFSLLKRGVKDGSLIRLKRDFYLIQNKSIETFEIASLLYGPSYISLESALSFHGSIPESVPIVNSACSKRTKKYETYLGIFAYNYIPISIFHVGVAPPLKDALENNSSFLVAAPWKAIADYIYLKKKTWPNIIALGNDLRIEIDQLQYSDLKLLEKLAKFYPSKRVRKALNILLKDLTI